MSTPKRKFAIAGTFGGSNAVVYWTGRAKVSRRWTALESRARTWASRESAEWWLSRIAPGRAMDSLRVLEVAP